MSLATQKIADFVMYFKDIYQNTIYTQWRKTNCKRITGKNLVGFKRHCSQYYFCLSLWKRGWHNGWWYAMWIRRVEIEFRSSSLHSFTYKYTLKRLASISSSLSYELNSRTYFSLWPCLTNMKLSFLNRKPVGHGVKNTSSKIIIRVTERIIAMNSQLRSVNP